MNIDKFDKWVWLGACLAVVVLIARWLIKWAIIIAIIILCWILAKKLYFNWH